MIIISIGRDENNRIALEDPFHLVSSYHAELKIKDNGSMFLFDKSSNGTFINGVKVPHRQDFPVYRGNSVMFANKLPLNWNLVPDVPSSEDTLRILTIGKNDDNDIHLNQHDRISRYHALLRITKDYKYFIYDLSTNGTFVNNLRIPTRSYYEVKYEDQLTFGGTETLNWKLVPTDKAAKKDLQKRKNPVKLPVRSFVIAASFVLIVALAALGYAMMGNKSVYKKYENSVCLIVNRFVYTMDFGELGAYDVIIKGGKVILFDPAKMSPNESSGTGFFVSKDGKLITNRHVAMPWSVVHEDAAAYDSIIDFADDLAGYMIARLSNANAKTNDANVIARNNKLMNAWFNTEIRIGGHSLGVSVLQNNTFYNNEKDLIGCQVLKVANDERVDISVMQTNSKTLPPKVSTIIDLDDIVKEEDLQPGKKVFILGFPMGLKLAATSQGIKANFQDGQVSRESDGFSFGHNISSTGGASGSPVFDEDGRLAGVHFSGFRTEAGFKFAITAVQAKKIVDGK
jgi:pSer/pThr/pTyr-binding forkhead associated (FHA) protein